MNVYTYRQTHTHSKTPIFQTLKILGYSRTILIVQDFLRTLN